MFLNVFNIPEKKGHNSREKIVVELFENQYIKALKCLNKDNLQGVTKLV